MLTIPSWRTLNAVKILSECSEDSSTYSPYAAFTLASGDGNKTNALALLAKADIGGFPLRSRALLKAARLYEELGNTQKARELYERILREFPASPAAAEVRRIQ